MSPHTPSTLRTFLSQMGRHRKDLLVGMTAVMGFCTLYALYLYTPVFGNTPHNTYPGSFLMAVPLFGIALLSAIALWALFSPHLWWGIHTSPHVDSADGIPAILYARIRAYQHQIHQHGVTPAFAVTATFVVADPLGPTQTPPLHPHHIHANTPYAPWLSNTILATDWTTELRTRLSQPSMTAQTLALYTRGPTLTITVPPLTAHEIVALRCQTPRP